MEDRESESFSYFLSSFSSSTHQSTTTSWTTRSQLDQWFDALHPSRYTPVATDDSNSNSNINSNRNTAWTKASYKGEELLRQTAWVTLDEHCHCEYGYSDTWQHQATDPKFCAVVDEITRTIQQLTGCTSLNACNLNYYPHGGGVGFHADDEFLFDGLRRPTCIISLSLCRGGHHDGGDGARKFIIKPSNGNSEEQVQNQYNDKDKDKDNNQRSIVLAHGDLMTMEGMFQKHYFHSIWPGDSKEYMDSNDPYIQGERINLTFRTIVQHLDGSDECRGKVCPLYRQPNSTT